MKYLYFFLLTGTLAAICSTFQENEIFEELESLIKRAVAKFQKDVAYAGFYTAPFTYYRRETCLDMNFEINATAIRLMHLNEARLEYLEIRDGYIIFNIAFPIFNGTAIYAIPDTGKIGKEPISGKGIFKINATKLRISGFALVTATLTSTRINRLEIDYDFEDIYFHMDGLKFMGVSEMQYNEAIFGQLATTLKINREKIAARESKNIENYINGRLVDVPLRDIATKIQQYILGRKNLYNF